MRTQCKSKRVAIVVAQRQSEHLAVPVAVVEPKHEPVGLAHDPAAEFITECVAFELCVRPKGGRADPARPSRKTMLVQSSYRGALGVGGDLHGLAVPFIKL